MSSLGLTAAVSAPPMLGTVDSFNAGNGSPYDALSMMNFIWMQDLWVTQARWARSARSLAAYAGCVNDAQSGLGGGNGFVGSGFGAGGPYSQYNFNEIATKVNVITGRERQHRKSLTCQSTDASKNQLATDFSKVFSYCENKNNLAEKFSRGFEKGVITGLALGEVCFNRQHDVVNGDIDFKIYDYNSFILDYTSRDIWNFSDCKYIWLINYMGKSEAMAAYPDHAMEISTSGAAPYGNPVFYYLPEAVNPRQKNVVAMSRFWQQVVVDREVWINLNTGETLRKVPKQFQDSPLLKKITVPVNTWKLSVLVNQTLLSEETSPYGIDDCPFVAFTWDYDPEIQPVQYRVRGMPDALVDAQYLLNRTTIKNHNMVEASINAGWVLQENSLVNEDTPLRAGEGINMVYKQGSEAPHKILPTSIPESSFMLIKQLREQIEIASAVKSPLEGHDEVSKSGIMSMVRQDAADGPLQKYWDRVDLARKRLGMLEMKMTSKQWTAHKFARVLNKDPSECEALLDIEVQDFSLVVSEGIYTDIQKRSEFVNFAEVCAMLGIKPPVRLMLDKAPIQGTDELINALEMQEKSQQEANEQKQAVELALMQAEIKKVNAQALEQLNMAASHHARAGSYAGLENERNAEVQKNQALATKNNADTLLKLLPLIDKYGIDKVLELVSLLHVNDTFNMEKANGAIETTIPEPSLESEGPSSEGSLLRQDSGPSFDGKIPGIP